MEGQALAPGLALGVLRVTVQSLNPLSQGTHRAPAPEVLSPDLSPLTFHFLPPTPAQRMAVRALLLALSFPTKSVVAFLHSKVMTAVLVPDFNQSFAGATLTLGNPVGIIRGSDRLMVDFLNYVTRTKASLIGR